MHHKKLSDEIIARFRQSIDKFNQEAKRGYDISFAYGIIEFNPDKHNTIEALLADGDSMMYEHKK